jgi:hypothetical protein
MCWMGSRRAASSQPSTSFQVDTESLNCCQLDSRCLLGMVSLYTYLGKETPRGILHLSQILQDNKTLGHTAHVLYCAQGICFQVGILSLNR